MPDPEIPTDKDNAKPVSNGAIDPEGDKLIYRVPEPPPTDGTITIDQRDGTFTYRPSLAPNGSG